MKNAKFASITLLIFVLLLISGCGGRSIDKVEEAIQGHWEVTYNGEDSAQQIYIGNDKLTTVINGTETQSDYKIVNKNEEAGEIEITTTDATEGGLNYQIKFTDDSRTSAEGETDALEIKSSSKKEEEALDLISELSKALGADTALKMTWKYIDDEQTP